MKRQKLQLLNYLPYFLIKKKQWIRCVMLFQKQEIHGAKLIVFPEAFISGYPDWVWFIPPEKTSLLNKLYVDLVENAVSIPDNSTKKLCEAAKSANINVVVGMNERNSETSNSSLYNTLLFIDENGNILGKHRKLMPTNCERIIWAQGNGSTLKAYNTSVGKIRRTYLLGKFYAACKKCHI